MNASAKDFLAGLSSGSISSSAFAASTKIPQLSISAGGEDMLLPIGFQGIGNSCRKKNSPFVATHATTRKAPGGDCKHQERAEIVIVRLATQGATFFHSEEPTPPR